MPDLISPDAELNSKYKFGADLQRCILAFLLRDRVFVVQTLSLIQPHYFTNQVHEDICRIAIAFFNKYNVLINIIELKQELKDLTKDEKKYLIYEAELNTVLKDYYFPGLDTRESFLDRVAIFAKIQSIKLAFNNSLELIKKNPHDDATWFKIDELYKNARSVNRSFSLGLAPFQEYELFYEELKKAQEENEFFSSGFTSIDDALGGGLTRGEIGVWMALPGVGKSLALLSAVNANLRRGKKVLLVSCEMSELRIAARFYAQHSSSDIKKLVENKNHVISSILEFQPFQKAEDKRLLLIKKFAAGTLTVNMLRGYYSQIVLYGFKPDVLIVDYVGEMADYPGIPTHESKEKLLRDLKGFGEEEGHGTYTAIQPNIKAKEQEKEGLLIDDQAQGGSFGQQRPVDAMWSITQTPAEKEAGVARGFAIKHREGKSKFVFYIGFDYNTGSLKVYEISHANYMARMNHVVEKKSDQVCKLLTDEEKDYSENKT